jgi:hypothetical protein
VEPVIQTELYAHHLIILETTGCLGAMPREYGDSGSPRRLEYKIFSPALPSGYLASQASRDWVELIYASGAMSLAGRNTSGGS